MRRILVALAVFAIVLTGCGDGQPPDAGDLPSGTPTRSLNPSDRPTRPEATTGPTRTADPTTSTPDPTTVNAADPTTSEAAPTTSDAEPTTSEAEPTTSEAETPTSEPSESPSSTKSAKPAAEETDSTPWWPWLLLALVIVGGLIWWLMGRRRRSAEWQAQFDAAIRQAGWLVEHPVSAVVEAPSAAAMNDAWAEASTTIRDVDQQLFGLRDTAPNDTSRQTLDATRAALDELRGALLALVEGVRTAASPDVQRQQTVAVERARESLRRVIRPEGTST